MRKTVIKQQAFMVKLRFVDFVIVNTFLTKNTKEDIPSHVIESRCHENALSCMGDKIRGTGGPTPPPPSSSRTLNFLLLLGFLRFSPFSNRKYQALLRHFPFFLPLPTLLEFPLPAVFSNPPPVPLPDPNSPVFPTPCSSK